MYSPRGAGRFQKSERFSRRLQKKILSVRLPTALVSAPTSVPIVVCLSPLLPNTVLAERPPSMPSLDLQARLRLWPNSRTSSYNRQSLGWTSAPTPFVRQNSPPNQYLTQHCSYVFCQVRSVSTCTGFGPKVDRMVRFEALLFQVMKEIRMASVFSRSS